MSAAALMSTTRSALGAMVEQEARRVGSRTVAYERIAQTVGTSASWVRKFLAGSPEVKEPRIGLFLNIRQAYGNLCERIEQQNRSDELRLRSLKDGLNEITSGFSAEGAAQAKASMATGEGE